MKRPAFLFYMGDWMKDAALSMCSPATRGIWIDLICRMHDSDSGRIAGTICGLARICRCSEDELKAAFVELAMTKTAVIEVEDEAGVRDLSAICPQFVRNLSASFPHDCHSSCHAGCHAHVTVVCRRIERECETRAKAARRKELERSRKRRTRSKDDECHANVTPDVTPDVTEKSRAYISFSITRGTNVTDISPPRSPPTEASREQSHLGVLGDALADVDVSTPFDDCREASSATDEFPEADRPDLIDEAEWLVIEAQFLERWDALPGVMPYVRRAFLHRPDQQAFRERWLDPLWRKNFESAVAKFPLTVAGKWQTVTAMVHDRDELLARILAGNFDKAIGSGRKRSRTSAKLQRGLKHVIKDGI